MRTVKENLLAVPGILVSALPFGGCPACWPVYAGILSALGVSFLLSSAYLLPLTAFFLLIAVAALALRARHRRGYGPLSLAVAASALVLLGKFAVASQPVSYAGVGILIFASLWNAWPQRAAVHCPKCAPSEGGLVQLSAQENSHHEQQTNS